VTENLTATFGQTTAISALRSNDDASIMSPTAESSVVPPAEALPTEALPKTSSMETSPETLEPSAGQLISTSHSATDVPEPSVPSDTTKRYTACHKETDSARPLRECPKCHASSYCSRECQKADFKAHKKGCAAPAQEYAQTTERPMARPSAPKDAHRGGLQKWQFDT
jgi:hypothetical protein